MLARAPLFALLAASAAADFMPAIPPNNSNVVIHLVTARDGYIVLPAWDYTLGTNNSIGAYTDTSFIAAPVHTPDFC